MAHSNQQMFHVNDLDFLSHRIVTARWEFISRNFTWLSTVSSWLPEPPAPLAVPEERAPPPEAAADDGGPAHEEDEEDDGQDEGADGEGAAGEGVVVAAGGGGAGAAAVTGRKIWMILLRLITLDGATARTVLLQSLPQ